MAQGEGEKQQHTAAEKGKGKAPEVNGVNGTEGKKEPKRDKDGKIIPDGKDTGKPEAEELSEEDQQLKDELQMLVERLQVCPVCCARLKSMTNQSFLGTKSRAVPAVAGSHKRLDSDLNIINDRCT